MVEGPWHSVGMRSLLFKIPTSESSGLPHKLPLCFNTIIWVRPESLLGFGGAELE